MILGIDIGNTFTKLGIFNEGNTSPLHVYRYPTDRAVSTNDLEQIITRHLESADIWKKSVHGFILSSVVPELNQHYEALAEGLFGINPITISCRSTMSITIQYDRPDELGIDRIVNAEAVYRDYGGGYIIIDIGTAATFCVLLEDGTFDGGLIAPGIETTIKALSTSTAQLPEINFEKPERLVARGTLDALRSGYFYGWISLIEGIITRIRKEYERELKVIFTGGLATQIVDYLDIKSTIDDTLSMRGLKYLFDLNDTENFLDTKSE